MMAVNQLSLIPFSPRRPMESHSSQRRMNGPVVSACFRHLSKSFFIPREIESPWLPPSADQSVYVVTTRSTPHSSANALA